MLTILGWLRFLATRGERQFLKVYADHPMLTILGWLRFLATRGERQFLKVYADHPMLTILCWRVAHLVISTKFLRRSWEIFIIKAFRTFVFIFIIISTMFQQICPLAFFRCLSNSGTFTELRTTSFIESTGVACSDSVGHNRVQVLGIPVLLLVCSQDWTSNLQMIVSLEA